MNFSDLKVGDEVAIISSGWSRNYCDFKYVERITPSGMIGIGNMLFNKNNGSQRGGSYRLIEATQDLKDTVERNKTIQKAFQLMRNRQKLDYDTAKEIIKLLDGEVIK